MSEIVNVTITAPSADFLVQLTRHLVESGLAASGNIIDGARSVYRWDGEVCETDEAVASLRTQARHVDAIVAATRERHPYAVPHVAATPIVGANPEYERWVLESTAGVGE
ncbi:MAG: divalent-cation tolerance protein CutA [Actinomycetota bacterium]